MIDDVEKAEMLDASVALVFSSPMTLRPMGKSGARKTSPGGGGSD